MAEASSSRTTEAASPPLPDLVFGLVRAIGANSGLIEDELRIALEEARCHVERIRVAELFRQVPFLEPDLRFHPEYDRYRTHMNAGDVLRGTTGRSDAALLLALREVRSIKEAGAPPPTDRGARAWIIRALMHPDEVATLKRLYGTQTFAVSVFSPVDTRAKALTERIASSTGEQDAFWAPRAMSLLNRDVGVLDPADPSFGAVRDLPLKALLNVSKTFEFGDVFVDASVPEQARPEIRRFVELIFGHPFHTPTRDEFGMSIAYNASLRSASLGRRVGTAITTPGGDVVAIGVNDVPKASGGQYWPGDDPDGRDFQLGVDPSERIRRQVITDLFRRALGDKSWLGELTPDEAATVEGLFRRLRENLDETVKRVVSSETLRQSRIMDVIEYGRDVHAEMSALTDAARRGISVGGCTLYCTTFPCHECARHIVAAGILRVVYIEAYPKSRVPELFGDSVGLADRTVDLGRRVRFEPFVGVGPSRFSDLFSSVSRKLSDAGGPKDLSGKLVAWTLADGQIRETVIDEQAIRWGVRSDSVREAENYAVDALEALLADVENVANEEDATADQDQLRGQGTAPVD